MHHRLEPKKHWFQYNVFMFYIDLDELDLLTKQLWMISRNKFNFFSFRDNEHIQLPRENPDRTKSTKEHLREYLLNNKINIENGRIMLLTNLNVLGYNFNPVSFYFCFDEKNSPLCVVAEVGNTFGEIKPFFVGKENLTGDLFHFNTKKYFYVSPFIDHDNTFDFRLEIPKEKLNSKIDDYTNEKKIFLSTLMGNKKTLNNFNLLIYSFRFPFITLKIISLIHWNALLLWIKKIHYHKKSENMDLQKDVYKKY